MADDTVRRQRDATNPEDDEAGHAMAMAYQEFLDAYSERLANAIMERIQEQADDA
ncbi:MAG: hypothetical protein F6K09_14230, partial [Merismopedia sp. SIO2A8]|nr:hypothetical protein [Merismopedia sp. SIO2A8]